MERIESGVGAGFPRPNDPYWLRWALPSISDAIFLILFLFLVLGGKSLFGDSDTALHIGIGNHILETGSIPRTGIYSYTAAEMSWMAHEWLAELIFAVIHNITGLNGIVVLAALSIAFTHSTFYGFLISRGINTSLSLVLTIAAIAMTAVHWLARPHILSMPLVLIWYMALEAYRLEGKRYIYLLPILTVLWVNLHGGFMAGLLLIAVYWLGSMLDLLFSRDGNAGEKVKRDMQAYGKVGLLAAAASLLNPHGYKALLFPFQIVGKEASVGKIEEWLSPNFHAVQPYEYMLLTLIVVLGFSLRRLTYTETCLIVLWTHLSLHSVRYIPLFAIIVIPIIAVRLEGLMKDGMEEGNRLLNRIYEFSNRIQKTSESLKIHILPIVAVTAAMVITVNGGRVFGKPLIKHGFDKKQFPVEAVDFAENSGIKGRVFNAYHFGGYLIYEGFPKEGVFVDGRTDMYDKFLKNYDDVVDLKPGWRDVLKRFDIEWMLITANSPLSVLLSETDEWRLIYADKVANIFVRNTYENRHLIDKYTDVGLVSDKDNNKSLAVQ